MNDSGQQPLASRRPASLLAACGLLALVMIVVGAALSGWGYSHSGVAGVAAALVAVVVPWLAATAALIVSARAAGTPHALNATLGSIGLRTVVPMVLGLFLDHQVPYIAKAGFMGMLVVAYLAALAVETLLALRLIAPPRTAAKAL